MLVALYVGGKLQKGEDGVEYTKDAAFGFEVNENTTFHDVVVDSARLSRWRYSTAAS